MREIPVGNDNNVDNQDSDENDLWDNESWKFIIWVEARYAGFFAGAENMWGGAVENLMGGRAWINKWRAWGLTAVLLKSR